MGKRRRAVGKKRGPATARSAPDETWPQTPAGSEFTTSNLSLHELFAQQTRSLLDRTDLDEEHKQNILIAMSCPCCGAGGMSFPAKIKRRS
jgi:hypothetical protein